MLKEKPLMGCVNCGKRIWLYVYFKGPFLCEDCLGRAASIILRLKKRLTQRPPDSLKVAAKRQPRVSKSKVIRHKSG